MTEAARDREAAPLDDDSSMLVVATLLLRSRRVIVAGAVGGAVLGLVAGLTSPRVYESSAIFLPQGSEVSATGLALAASQLGIRIPTPTGGAWGPAVYAELLRSKALLAPIALDTVEVTEEGGRRVALADLLQIKAGNPAERQDRVVLKLGALAKSREVKSLGAVEVTVTTRWPSVSLVIADRMVEGVHRFNLETRKSQAAAERQFVEARARDAEQSLREAEGRLQVFLQRNRAYAGSPELTFQQDRLQREVSLRQQVYNTLLQSREEARIREVRDTPVITLLEEPRLPTLGKSRRTALKAALGLMGGGLIGMLVAFLQQGLAGVRRAPSAETREFLRLLDDTTPRFLRRKPS